jgi:hypothetical protein
MKFNTISARYATSKIEYYSIFQLLAQSIMRQMQLEMIFYSTNIILGAESEGMISRTQIGKERWENEERRL